MYNLKLETRNSKLLRRIAQLALIAVLAMLFLGADTDARFNKLGHQLMCMCGCNQVLLECNHVGCTYSDRMRNELTAGMERGDNDSLVLQSFVQKYGNTVLAAPTATRLQSCRVDHAVRGFCAGDLRRSGWFGCGSRARVAQPVARPNLAPEELDALRKKARQETEF